MISSAELFSVRRFRVHLAIGVLLAMIVGPLSFWMSDNVPPYKFFADESFIVPPEAGAGDEIAVWWKVKVNRELCAGVGHRVLFDPTTKAILTTYAPYRVATRLDLKDGYLIRKFILPKTGVVPGWVGYRSTLCYYCNPYQRYIAPMCVSTPDLFFKYEK